MAGSNRSHVALLSIGENGRLSKTDVMRKIEAGIREYKAQFLESKCSSEI